MEMNPEEDYALQVIMKLSWILLLGEWRKGELYFHKV